MTDKLDANEYRHFCRMLAAVLDRASKAEQLQYDLEQARKLIVELEQRLENERGDYLDLLERD